MSENEYLHERINILEQLIERILITIINHSPFISSDIQSICKDYKRITEELYKEFEGGDK